MTLENKLKLIRDFQMQYPYSHVGGSLGLFLHGVDLKRDLGRADIDMTVKSEIKPDWILELGNTQESSGGEDFDYQFRHFPDGYQKPYVKLDINIRPEKNFCVVNHGGFYYNVSRIEDIMAWKHFYSMKGAGKHTDDLETIRTGVRPTEVKLIPVSVCEVDDLPF